MINPSQTGERIKVPPLDIKSIDTAVEVEKPKSNNEILFNVTYQLNQMIEILNPKLEINQIVISKLKNIILTIYHKINEKKDQVNKVFLTERNISVKNSEKGLDNLKSERNNCVKRIQEFSNGIYEGDIKYGKKEGKGKMHYKDGYEYEGEWKNDKWHGKGIYFKDNIKYEGEFNLGRIHGFGIYNSKNGDRYEGYFVNWLREGKGTYFYNNGDKYVGEFQKDLMNGKGIYYYKNGNIYEGEFKNGKPDGYGIFRYNFGVNKGNRYEGLHKEWNKDGKGVLYYNNGNRYEGDFKNDMKNGKGIIYYKNGDREIGDYEDDKKIGIHVKLTYEGEILMHNYC